MIWAMTGSSGVTMRRCLVAEQGGSIGNGRGGRNRAPFTFRYP